jgi:hypothetical protein
VAIAFGSNSALVTSTSGSLTPTLPSGTATNDFLCMHVAHGSATAMTAPSGWTLATSVAIGGTHTVHLMWKFAGAGETNPTFTGTTTNGMWGVLSRFTGVPVRANPFHVAATAATGSGTAMAGASMTPSVTGAMAVWLWTQNDNGVTSTVDNSATVAYSGSSYDSVVGLDSNQSAAYKLMATAVATGVTTMTSASGTANGCIRFMLDPTPSTLNVNVTGTTTASSTVTAQRQQNAATTGTTTATSAATAYVPPGTVLGIGSVRPNHFSLQYAADGAGSSATATQADIEAGFALAPNFVTTAAANAVNFQVRADGALLGGSTTPRVELREVNPDGTDMAFDAMSGTHMLHLRAKITHLPAADPEVVVCQLHNGTTDRISIRTQLISAQTKLLCRINGTAATPRFEETYVTGTEFEVLVKVSGAGAVEVYYNGATSPTVTGQLVTTGSASWYFKAGAYAQFDTASTGSSTEYVAVETRDLWVAHAVGDVSGTTTASSTVSAARQQNADVAGPLTVGSSPAVVRQQNAAVAGPVTVAAAPAVVRQQNAAVAGSVASGSVPAAVRQQNADVAGTTTSSASPTASVTSAGVDVTGSVTSAAVVSVVRTDAASVSGSVASAATPAVVRQQNATVMGATASAVTTSVTRQQNAAVTGSTATAASPVAVRQQNATVTGATTSSATPAVARQQNADVTGASAVAATTSVLRTQTANVTGTTTSTGAPSAGGAADVTGTTSSTGTVAVVRQQNAAITGSTASSGTTAVVRQQNATVAGSTATSASTAVTRTDSANVAGSVSPGAVTSTRRTDSATITGAVTVSGSTSVGRIQNALVSASATISAAITTLRTQLAAALGTTAGSGAPSAVRSDSAGVAGSVAISGAIGASVVTPTSYPLRAVVTVRGLHAAITAPALLHAEPRVVGMHSAPVEVATRLHAARIRVVGLHSAPARVRERLPA